jgi:hypothetical protein
MAHTDTVNSLNETINQSINQSIAGSVRVIILVRPWAAGGCGQRTTIVVVRGMAGRGGRFLGCNYRKKDELLRS